MINSLMPNARKEGLVIQEMPNEVLVYDLESNKAHCLNQTAASVWRSCDGVSSVEEIKAKLEKEFKTTIPEDFVWLALDQLSKDKLLEKEIETKVSGLSRREVIKKIGLASMAALPVVAMLSFPQSALAVACPASAVNMCFAPCGSGQSCCAPEGGGQPMCGNCVPGCPI